MFGRNKNAEPDHPEWAVDAVGRGTDPVSHPLLPGDAAQWTGRSFGRGVIRFHDAASARQAAANVEQTFGVHPDQVAWFADDWLGRQFGTTTGTDGTTIVMAADLATANVAPFLRWDAFVEAVESGAIVGPVNGKGLDVFLHLEGLECLPVDKCASFKQPPFLGGDSSTGNLELSDVDVYWGVIGQVISGLAVPEGEQ